MVGLGNKFALWPDQLKATVNLRRPVQTAGTGNEPELSFATITATFKVQVEKLSEGLAERMFGQDATERWRAITDAGRDVRQNDLIEILTGPYGGQSFIVKGARDPLGMTTIIKGDDTEEGVAVATSAYTTGFDGGFA